MTSIFYNFIGKTFMPEMDEGDIVMQSTKLPSINLVQTANIDQRVQAAILKAVPEVQSIVSRAGADELGSRPDGAERDRQFPRIETAERMALFG